MTYVNSLALFDNHDCYRGDVLFNLKRSQMESGIDQNVLQTVSKVDDVLIGLDYGRGVEEDLACSVKNELGLSCFDSVYFFERHYCIVNSCGELDIGLIPHDLMTTTRFLKSVVSASLSQANEWRRLFRLSKQLERSPESNFDNFNSTLDVFRGLTLFHSDVFLDSRFDCVQEGMRSRQVEDFELLCAAFGINLRQMFKLPALLIAVEIVSRMRLLFESFKDVGVYLDEVFGDIRSDGFYMLNNLSYDILRCLDDRIKFEPNCGLPIVPQQCLKYVTMPFAIRSKRFNDEI